MKNKILLLLLFIISQNIYTQISKTDDYYIKLQFEYISNKIIIPVKIKNKEYKFLLDTGASNMISDEIFNLIKPKILKNTPVKDTSGKKDTLKVVEINKIVINNVKFNKEKALVYNFSSSPLKCFNIDGIIGSDLFENSILQIDLDKKSIIITNNRGKLNLQKKYSKKMKLLGTQKKPYIWIKLQGSKKGKEQVLFDTGMSNLYDLAIANYKIFKTKNIFTFISKSNGASALGLFGDVKNVSHYKLLLPQLSINAIKIKNLTINTINGKHSRIGSELLKYGRVTIDFINERFYFKPKNKEVNVEKPIFAFSTTLKNDKLIIGFVWDENLKNKLKFGNEVLEINNISITQEKICQLITKEWNLNKLNTIKLKIKSEKGDILEFEIHKKQPLTINKNNNG